MIVVLWQAGTVIVGAMVPVVQSAYWVGKKRGTTITRSALAAEAAKPKFVCDGCTHPYSYHEGENGSCAHTETTFATQTTIARTTEGKAIRDRFGDPVEETETTLVGTVPCGCQKYTGNVPYTTYV